MLADLIPLICKSMFLGADLVNTDFQVALAMPLFSGVFFAPFELLNGDFVTLKLAQNGRFHFGARNNRIADFRAAFDVTD